ncbi:hypothetical protein C8R46DRAFT_1223534 [Mycena filopes]|nr:hypothetical protein C8R46DRAFT_1223534 [Mycena filopes]
MAAVVRQAKSVSKKGKGKGPKAKKSASVTVAAASSASSRDAGPRLREEEAKKREADKAAAAEYAANMRMHNPDGNYPLVCVPPLQGRPRREIVAPKRYRLDGADVSDKDLEQIKKDKAILAALANSGGRGTSAKNGAKVAAGAKTQDVGERGPSAAG